MVDHVVDLLEQDGRPIALIEVIPKPSHLLIENLAVLPDRHDESIGGLLLGRSGEIGWREAVGLGGRSALNS